MKNCPNCYAQIDDDAKFCIYCGTKFENKPCCPKCGSLIAPGTKFCTSCGTKLISTSSNEQEEQRRREKNEKAERERIRLEREEAEKVEQERIRQEKLQEEHRRASIVREEKRRKEAEQEKKTIRITIAVILFFVLAVGVGVIYCISPSTNQSRALSNVDVRQGSVEPVEPNAIETERNVTADVHANEENQTVDMKFLDVYGPVKTVMYKDEWNTDIYSYDKNGNIISVTLHDVKCKIERNDKGQIIALDYRSYEEGDVRFYTYNSDGRVSCMTYEYGEIKYTYNGGGSPNASKTYAEATLDSKYSYSSFDSQGNWTKKTENGKNIDMDVDYVEEQTRIIEYY